MRADTILRLLLLWRQPDAPPDRWLGARRLAIGWVVAAAVLGIAARLLTATQGHNYDIESYWIVANIVDEGGNVYAETRRYNYGPAWFLILGAIKELAEPFPEPFVAFRYLVPTLLSAVDLWIAFMLARRFGRLTATLFVLNPVVILITGYHSQFDNLAVAVGLAAMLLLERADRSDGSGSERRWWTAGVVVLGLSLVVKHLLVVLPVWLAMRQRSLTRSAVILLLPPAILIGSFLPFVAEGGSGIVANVIEYRSAENAPFHTWLLPGLFQRHLSEVMLFGGVLLLLGLAWRHRPPVERLLLYTVAVVIVSPGLYNQYLAIPAAAMAAFMNVGYLAYVAASAAYLVADGSNLGNLAVRELLPGFLVRQEMGDLPYAYLIGLLSVGLMITAMELYWHERRNRRTP